MSYTVLARRYRSATFDEVVGQNHVAQTLKRAIESNRIAHAYLFNGTRGVGKTSMARIMAKALNCEKAEGPTAEPCLKCQSCAAIARGDDIDVIEIDAASNTGVDNVRDIIENAQYRPARSRFKVYIIDEVHMLSKSAFNALLKTLEEPPSHVKFILATTEPEKVLPTILSRCQRYDFRNIPTREIAEHLKEICRQEKIKADEDALMVVAKAGAGSMRDSLSLLDRLLSAGEMRLTAGMVEQMLGLPRAQAVLELAQAIGEGRVKDVLTAADRMVGEGLSPDALLVSLIDHLRNLLIIRTCGADSSLVEPAALSLEELQEQAQAFDPVVVMQDITILEDLRRQLRQTQAGRALLEATLVRLALAEQFTSVGDLLARVDRNGIAVAAPEKKKPDGPAARSPVMSSSPAARTQVPSALDGAQGVRAAAEASISASPETATPDDDDGDELPRPGKVWDAGPKVSLAALMKQHAAAAKADSNADPATKAVSDPKRAGDTDHAASNIEPADPSNLPAVWQNLLRRLEQHGPALFALIEKGRFAGIEDGQAIIRYGPEHETFPKMLGRNGKKELVSEALSQVLGHSVGVRFELDDTAAGEEAAPCGEASPRHADVPVAREQEVSPPPLVQPPSRRLTPEQMRELEKDPLIAALISELDATILKLAEE